MIASACSIEVDSPHGDGHELAARRDDRIAHHLERRVLTRARDQSRGKLAAGDDERCRPLTQGYRRPRGRVRAHPELLRPLEIAGRAASSRRMPRSREAPQELLCRRLVDRLPRREGIELGEQRNELGRAARRRRRAAPQCAVRARESKSPAAAREDRDELRVREAAGQHVSLQPVPRLEHLRRHRAVAPPRLCGASPACVSGRAGRAGRRRAARRPAARASPRSPRAPRARDERLLAVGGAIELEPNAVEDVALRPAEQLAEGVRRIGRVEPGRERHDLHLEALRGRELHSAQRRRLARRVRVEAQVQRGA